MRGEPTRSQPIATRIAPWLSVANAAQAVTYYQMAFDAVEVERLEDEQGSVVVSALKSHGLRNETYRLRKNGGE